MAPAEDALKVVFDCQFADLMTEKVPPAGLWLRRAQEIISTHRQLQYCYHHNQVPEATLD